MTLRTRIVGVVTLVVAVVILGVGFAVHQSTERSLIAEIDGDLLSRAEALRPERGGRLVPDEALERFRAFTQEGGGLGGPARGRNDPFVGTVGFDAMARVLDAEGNVRRVLDGEFDSVVDATLLAAADEGPVISGGDSSGGEVRIVTAALPGVGYVQYARALAEVDAVLSDMRVRTSLIGLLAILFAGGLAWVVSGRTVRPIQDLTKATEHIAATGDLEHSLISIDATPGTGDEVGRLSASFGSMLSALSSSRRQQRQLVMDASHELRTPLTSLRTNVDVLGRGHELSAEDRASLVADLDAELGELSDLVAELVDLATDVRTDEDLAPLTLAQVAGPVVERARRRTNRSIEVVVVRDVVLEARPESLARAVRNLVDNAAKFSPAGSDIQVVIDGGELVVHDAGPGIPEADRKAVFDRFHRVEATRTMPGSGLGLAIVRQVAEAHGGSVFAEDSADGGAAVGFRLPTID